MWYSFGETNYTIGYQCDTNVRVVLVENGNYPFTYNVAMNHYGRELTASILNQLSIIVMWFMFLFIYMWAESETDGWDCPGA
jgi:uncharacterized membrane protein